MPRFVLCALCLAWPRLVPVVAAVPSQDDIMDVHPDGTPEHPKELKEFLMSWKGDLVKAYGPKVRDAVMGDDLDAFTETFQEHNHKFIFNDDGSAKDIANWRENVRMDEFYSSLLLENAPDMHRIITDPAVPDEEVQDMLRSQQQAMSEHLAKQQQQQKQESKFNFKPPKQEL